MKDIWKPKHTVWFKKNDDDELGETFGPEAKRRREQEREHAEKLGRALHGRMRKNPEFREYH